MKTKAINFWMEEDDYTKLIKMKNRQSEKEKRVVSLSMVVRDIVEKYLEGK